VSKLVKPEGLAEFVDDFLDLYPRRPVAQNFGGMGLNHSFGLYAVLRALKPSVVIESGVWKGQSTWLIESAVPDAEVFCLDPRPDHRSYTSPRATYITDDFAGVDWSGVDREDALCFFDDHQNAYSRLMEMRWWGFRRALFEDNFPAGQGDNYSLRHVRAGFGHPQIQMSPGYQPRGRSLKRRVQEERVLQEYYWRQAMIRRPNWVDAAALEINLRSYVETPPLVLNPATNWGTSWDGPYELQSEPIFKNEADSPKLFELLRALAPEDAKREREYGYMCFVELKRNAGEF